MRTGSGSRRSSGPPTCASAAACSAATRRAGRSTGGGSAPSPISASAATISGWSRWTCGTARCCGASCSRATTWSSPRRRCRGPAGEDLHAHRRPGRDRALRRGARPQGPPPRRRLRRRGRAQLRDRRRPRDPFAIGGHLATPDPDKVRKALARAELAESRAAEFERVMDEAETELPELRAFVLPAGTPKAAALHLARTVCRRAERSVIHLSHESEVPTLFITYLNRLSDLLFTLARVANHRDGAGDVTW